MYSKLKHLFLPGLFILAVPVGWAAEITVSSNVDKSEITIGGKIKYQITVEYPETGSVELPSVLGNLGSFEVKEYDVSQPEKTEKGLKQTWNFLISTFTVGQYTLPPQVVEYTPENDTAKQALYTEPIVINVLRTSPETVKDIADITGLAEIAAGNRWIWTLLALSLLVGGGIALLFFRTRQKAGDKTPPPKPPYQEAVDLLAELKTQDLPGNGMHKAYCFSLSEILRRYITRRFEIEALESTTEEFLEKIRKIELTAAQREIITGFCAKTDPVKFAEFSLTGQESAEVFDQVKTIVEQTKPRVVEKEETDKK